jgi:hypothetical protein
MDKELLVTDLEQNSRSLLQEFSEFPEELLFTTPPDNGWSGAQICEHLLILDRIANKVISGETIESTRPSDEKLGLIRSVMLDIENRRVAPERVQPVSAIKDRKLLIDALNAERKRMREMIQTLDITQACISGKHPALGTLTILEWVYFIIYHTERHIGQLQRLHSAISA